MTHVLRSAAGDDLGALAAWIRSAEECDRWAGPHLRYPFTGAELPARLAAMPAVVAGEVRAAHVLVDDAHPDEPLAYGEIIRETSESARLGRIIVAPEHRRRGLGGVLCRMLAARAQANGALTHLRLLVYRDNEDAVRLYRNLGMAVDASHASERVLVMRMALARP